VCKWSLLKLKTQLRLCPVSWSLSMDNANDSDMRHWQLTTFLGNLGWCDTVRNRIVPIFVMPPKVAKASTIVTVACCRHFHLKKHRQCTRAFNKTCVSRHIPVRTVCYLPVTLITPIKLFATVSPPALIAPASTSAIAPASSPVVVVVVVTFPVSMGSPCVNITTIYSSQTAGQNNFALVKFFFEMPCLLVFSWPYTHRKSHFSLLSHSKCQEKKFYDIDFFLCHVGLDKTSLSVCPS